MLLCAYVWFAFSLTSNVAITFINKKYATKVCVRKSTSLEKLLASSLKYALQKNSPTCKEENSVNYKNEYEFQKRRERRQTTSWNQPTGLPQGAKITFCNSDACCVPKKTLNSAGSTYNLCRECIHTITLPASYSPRELNHITCQDTDYYETCLSGEGTCTTNLIRKTVASNKQTITLILGQSCSCEILKDSIFVDYI